MERCIDSEKSGKYDIYKRDSEAKGLKNLALFGLPPQKPGSGHLAWRTYRVSPTVSQTMILSSPTETKSLPSGLHSTSKTAFSCWFKTPTKVW